MTDPRVAKVVQAGILRLVVSTDAESYIGIMEDAGLVVIDPHAGPYSFLTHEYPPTLELAVAVINRLANYVQWARENAAQVWDEGHTAGWNDAQADAREFGPDGSGAQVGTENPYRLEADHG
jgi:hypothetical protein